MTESPSEAASAEELLAHLKRHAQRQRLLAGIGGLFAVVFAVFLLLVTLPAMIAIIITAVCAWLAQNERKKMYRILGEHQDLRVVGPLLERWAQGDNRPGSLVVEALIGLLPRLQTNEAGFLTEAHRQDMREALEGPSTPLALSILAAWRQIGNRDDLPLVERLAAGQGRAADNETVREAAQESLKALRKRVKQERSS